jgi:predicted metal-dependent hydrolase
MPFVIVENEVIDYFLVKKDKKNIGIIIKPNGTVVVTAPRYLSEKQINDVVQKKAVIIRKRLYQIKENLDKSVKKKIEDGESILFMGKTYRIRIKEDEFIPSLKIIWLKISWRYFLIRKFRLNLKTLSRERKLLIGIRSRLKIHLQKELFLMQNL